MISRSELTEFEYGIRELWEAGELPCLLHLGGGNEEQLVNIFKDIKPGDWVFSTHRNHYHALLAGIPAEEVKSKILDGRSMFIYSKAQSFFCSAVLAGTCGIAAGVAWQLKEELRSMKEEVNPASQFLNSSFLPLTSPRVWCFIGDGGEEQGHFYEAAMFVEANELPCTFIIEDNNRSVDTPRDIRRGNAKGLEHLFKCVRRYEYMPTYPHAGSGCTFQIEFKQDAIERMKPRAAALRSPSASRCVASQSSVGEGGFLGSLAEHPHPDAFHHATTKPYGGDCGRKTSDLLKGT